MSPTTPIQTYSGRKLTPYQNPDKAKRSILRLKPSQTFSAGQLVGQYTASAGTYGVYASGNSDGTQIPTHVLEQDCVTDASGNITFGGDGLAAGAGEWGVTRLEVSAFHEGEFACEDLIGLDANAVTKLGKLLVGTTSSGVLSIS